MVHPKGAHGAYRTVVSCEHCRCGIWGWEFGGLGAAVSSTEGTVRESPKGPASVRSPEDEEIQHVFGNEADWSKLIQWLDRGEVILAMVQQRVIRRALVAAVALFAVVAFIAIDFVGAPDFRMGASTIEWQDLVGVVAVTLGPRLVFFRNWLLRDAEKKFLQNFHDLEEAFYRRGVAPKIDLFNAVFSRLFSHVSGSADEELAEVRDELRKLSERVSATESRSATGGSGPRQSGGNAV
jgi:hypothetical protein